MEQISTAAEAESIGPNLPCRSGASKISASEGMSETSARRSAALLMVISTNVGLWRSFGLCHWNQGWLVPQENLATGTALGGFVGKPVTNPHDSQTQN